MAPFININIEWTSILAYLKLDEKIHVVINANDEVLEYICHVQ